MTIEILSQPFTVCKVDVLPPDCLTRPFCFVGKTDRECSLVCETDAVPQRTLAREDGWRGFRIAGTLEFSLVGILSRLSAILAENSIGIFAVSTYDTDYIFVREEKLALAEERLSENGYAVSRL